MSFRVFATASLLVAAALCGAEPVVDAKKLPVEVARALAHSPLPPPPVDPSNEVQANPNAQELGRILFADVRLSGTKKVSCATCHRRDQGWSDGRPVASNGKETGIRRTPSIRNAAYQRWFNWDGSADSLWAQVLGPIESSREMAGNRYDVAQLLAGDVDLNRRFISVFGDQAAQECVAASDLGLSSQSRRAVATNCFRNVGKALAAFVATIVSKPNRFDGFVERVKSGTAPDRAGFSAREFSGLQLFFGRGRCYSCHTGPLFSNGEFHNLALYPTVPGGWTDAGRFGGIKKLLASEFNQLHAGVHPEQLDDKPIRYLTSKPSFWGQFKTPSLRNASTQAYYMHHGQFSSLAQVIRFYSDFTGLDVTDHHRELSVMPLRLTADEQSDLVTFLQLIGE